MLLPILITIRIPLTIWNDPLSTDSFTLWSTVERWKAADGSLHRTRKGALRA